MTWLLVLAPIGGILNRARGGLWATNIRKLVPFYRTGAARLMFAAATALFASMVQPELWPIGTAIFALLMWAGLLIGWFDAADIGVDGDRSAALEVAIMSGRGLILTGLAGIGIGVWDSDMAWPGAIFALSGLAIGPLYWLAWKTPNLAREIRRGMEVGELYTGAWLWAALAIALS